MSQRREFRPLATDVLEDRVVLSQAAVAPHAVVALQAFPPGSIRAQNEAYIESLYAFVGQTPNFGGVRYHEIRLTHGTSTRLQTAQAFVNTTAFRNTETTVLFRQLLDRNPSQADLNFFAQNNQGRNHSLGITALQILSSDEYYNNAGGTNQGLVTRLYSDVFGRATDPSAQFWVNALNSGVSRQQVISQILNSPEGAQNFVGLAFGQVLNRAPGLDGPGYVNFLNHGGTFEHMIASLLASQEYYNNAQLTPTPV